MSAETESQTEIPEVTVPCPGAGQAWVHEDEGNANSPLVCPGCQMTPKDLGIKRTGKAVKVAPEHEVTYEGWLLDVDLEDGEYKVHDPDCPQLAKRIKKLPESDQPFPIIQSNPRDVILELWADQIEEAWDPETDETDSDDLPSEPSEDWLSSEGYYASTKFHTCLKDTPFRATSKGGGNGSGANGNRAAKKALANLMISAMAQQLESILETNLAGTDPTEAMHRLVLSGMDNATIKKTASNWVHHLPADRDFWAATGFPIPDRSDWRTPAEVIVEAAETIIDAAENLEDADTDEDIEDLEDDETEEDEDLEDEDTEEEDGTDADEFDEFDEDADDDDDDLMDEIEEDEDDDE